MRFLFLSILLSPLLFSLNFDISSNTLANGTTALIEFEKEADFKYEKIVFGDKSFKVYEHPLNKGKLYALLPVSYYKKPSDATLEVHYKENGVLKNKTLALKIKSGEYKKEKIEVDKSKVNPDKKHADRISKEYNEAMKIYFSASEKSYLNSEFIQPLDSFITSDFGKARVYNDTLKGYHSGTDFRAKVGTPVVASNDGVVVLAKDRFYSGDTIIIDHGHGIYTCYFHMSKFNVKKNQKVKKGDVIGLSGQSGRVTGPHLHFAVRIGGVQVDPMQFLSLMNERVFLKKDTALASVKNKQNKSNQNN